MILVIGNWHIKDVGMTRAKEHLIDTEKFHQIYRDDAIIDPNELFETLPFLEERQQLDLLFDLLRMCDTVYAVKSWENHNDSRLLHDYASCNGYKIIYSKKF